MDDADEHLIDNAATCSQHKALTDDESVRECIYLNIIRPLRERIAALEAELAAWNWYAKSPEDAARIDLEIGHKQEQLEAENERLRLDRDNWSLAHRKAYGDWLAAKERIGVLEAENERLRKDRELEMGIIR